MVQAATRSPTNTLPMSLLRESPQQSILPLRNHTPQNHPASRLPSTRTGWGSSSSHLHQVNTPAGSPTSPTDPNGSQQAHDLQEDSLDEIIALAVATSTAKLAAEVQSIHKKCVALESTLTDMINDNARKVAAATSAATIAALTGINSPFMT
jgi:hypothetical protein